MEQPTLVVLPGLRSDSCQVKLPYVNPITASAVGNVGWDVAMDGLPDEEGELTEMLVNAGLTAAQAGALTIAIPKMIAVGQAPPAAILGILNAAKTVGNKGVNWLKSMHQGQMNKAPGWWNRRPPVRPQLRLNPGPPTSNPRWTD